MSFGNTLGRGVGRSAATLVHAASVAASATGQFGTDLSAGTVQAYDEHSARLATIRKGAAPRSIKMAVKPRNKATA